jgi:hypothetical protein
VWSCGKRLIQVLAPGDVVAVGELSIRHEPEQVRSPAERLKCVPHDCTRIPEVALSQQFPCAPDHPRLVHDRTLAVLRSDIRNP